MRARVTIADVAREARVSTQTVSRVLNNKGEIRPQTRKLVLEVIQRLGYRPSTIARGLATNRTSTLGVVVPDVSNPFFAELVRGAEIAARQFGYHIFLCSTEQEPDREIEAVYALEDKWVDGIILCAPRLPVNDLRTVVSHGSSIVLIGRDLVEGVIGSVRADDEYGIRLAVNYLLAKGRQRLAFLAGRPGGPSHHARVRGFRQALCTGETKPHEERIIFCASNPNGGYEAASTALTKWPDTDGLLCFNDLVAIGALRACFEHGYRVPDDIAVVGFDDISLASLVHPSLTTVRVPQRELGEKAVAMLIDHIRGVQHEKQVMLVPQLVIRESA